MIKETLPQHMKPLDTIEGFPVRPGLYEYFGAWAIPGGVSFTVHSQNARSCEILLFHREAAEPYAVLPIPDNYRIGHVFSMIIFGLNIEEFEYAFRLDGPYEPEKGLIFDRKNILIDPYAKAITGQSTWGKKVQEKGYRARVVGSNFYWGVAPQLCTPIEDLIIYELHVRGFTKMARDVTAPGTFLGVREKIPYLKALGVNAVELMPVFEFDELMDERTVNGRKLLNYWGYSTVSFYAPNTSYASDIEYNREGLELKELVKELHENGIEIILDVVFNHTAEGNENGPVFSFKGFDNNVYYMLTPEGCYYNFSGCGNTMNCNHPVVQQMIQNCLRYWVTTYRIDGFRFDLASILGRNEDGSPMEHPPLLKSLAYDPLLGNTKLIAEAWDAGGLYQVGNFPSYQKWHEWNGRYRDDVRSFLKGDLQFTDAALLRIAGSPDIYAPEELGFRASVNFLTCHDGFTLYDLYSYNEKHNEANGWDNTDGANDNRSWNCGAEGETDEPDVLTLRMKMIRNACAVLMCSRGTPMFFAGDEFCNTQFGNNNPYCQDNEISWLDWSSLDRHQDIFQFFQYMIRFRKSHPVLRGSAKSSRYQLPGISFHSEVPWQTPGESNGFVAAVLFVGYDGDASRDDIVFLAINAHWEPHEVTLPQIPGGLCWHFAVNTGDEEHVLFQEPLPLLAGDHFLIGERSVIILVGR